MKQLAIIFLFGILFIGCSSKTLPAMNKYTLDITNQYNTQAKTKQPYTIKILEPTTSKLYNNTYIYYSYKPFTIYPYKINKWSDYPTKMIEQQLLQKLDSANIYKAVTTSAINGKYDFILQSELLQMVQIIKDKKSYSVFKIKFYILDKNNENIASKTFEYKIPNSTINAYGTVESYNKALNKMINELFYWLENTTKEV